MYKRQAWITNVDELNEVVSAATEVLLKRLIDLSDPNEGDYPVYIPPTISEPPPELPPEEGADPPADADTKHGNHTAEVAAAKQELIDEGKVFPKPGATDECFRFEIVERAVPKISGAGFLDKPGGTNCKGFAVDIIAFSDGYIYDVLVGSGDGSEPAWNPTGCGPVGGDGTCSERYRSP